MAGYESNYKWYVLTEPKKSRTNKREIVHLGKDDF